MKGYRILFEGIIIQPIEKSLATDYLEGNNLL